MTTPKPIPDEVLRDYAEWGGGPATDMMTGAPVTDHASLQWLLGITRLTGRDLARELVAIRKAARRVLVGELVSGMDDLRALLPEEPK